MNYYISDLHLGHYNIIKLCNRPFKSIDEMNNVLIKNWNSVVTDNDDVYIVGDLFYRTTIDEMLKILKKLKGKKHLITGNHDKDIIRNKELRNQFIEIRDILTINDNGIKIVLCHYPMVEWDGYYRDVLHFYGHIHNNFENATTKYISSIKNAYNVGADLLGFMPRTSKEIINRAA